MVYNQSHREFIVLVYNQSHREFIVLVYNQSHNEFIVPVYNQSHREFVVLVNGVLQPLLVNLYDHVRVQVDHLCWDL